MVLGHVAQMAVWLVIPLWHRWGAVGELRIVPALGVGGTPRIIIGPRSRDREKERATKGRSHCSKDGIVTGRVADGAHKIT